LDRAINFSSKIKVEWAHYYSTCYRTKTHYHVKLHQNLTIFKLQATFLSKITKISQGQMSPKSNDP